MIFSSVRFFVFLAILLVVLAPSYSTRRKKEVLAVASCVFYAAWDYRYLALLLLISVIDYVCAARIHLATAERSRKRWLAFSVISNLGILGYFKYTNFFIATLNGLFAPTMMEAIPAADILLPAGISFYTFKSMSYTIDVYRRHIEPVDRLLDYTTFITFFPELIAGPIVRASVLLPQMQRSIGPTRERLLVGANIFVQGLVKKKLVADRMAAIADPIFAAPADYSIGSLWCAATAYTIQIYCDFAGYSDMAIGTAKMIGYDLPENFDMPYASASITEFWRRWHMTLSFWLRDYLYIPLGGNRRGVGRSYVNQMITMLLGGLWHGASWNFVLWGALHGLLLGLHKAYRSSPLGKRFATPAWLGVPVTLLCVLLLWVPFRATSFAATGEMISRMFGADLGTGARFYPEQLVPALALLFAGHVFGALLRDPDARRPWLDSLLVLSDATAQRDPTSGTYVIFRGRNLVGAFTVAATIGVLFYYASASTSPFIYFQF